MENSKRRVVCVWFFIIVLILGSGAYYYTRDNFSFIDLGGGYSKDNSNVYFSFTAGTPTGTQIFKNIIQGANLKTFEVINTHFNVAKDNERVYNYNQILSDADVNTFQELKSENATFFKDKSHVWNPYTGPGNLELMKEADAGTFTLTPIQSDGVLAYDAGHRYAIGAKGFLVIMQK